MCSFLVSLHWVLRCYHCFPLWNSLCVKIQDFVSMHVFMLPGLWQTINKPAVLWLLNMFLFYPSAVILQFKFFWFSHPLFWKQPESGIQFCFQWEINNLWSMLWHIWHKMLKQKDRGLWNLVSKHTPAIGKSSHGELTINCHPVLIDSAAPPTHQAAGQRSNHITLPPTATLSLRISALTISKQCPLKFHFINNLGNRIQATLTCLFTWQMWSFLM